MFHRIRHRFIFPTRSKVVRKILTRSDNLIVTSFGSSRIESAQNGTFRGLERFFVKERRRILFVIYFVSGPYNWRPRYTSRDYYTSIIRYLYVYRRHAHYYAYAACQCMLWKGLQGRAVSSMISCDYSDLVGGCTALGRVCISGIAFSCLQSSGFCTF